MKKDLFISNLLLIVMMENMSLRFVDSYLQYWMPQVAAGRQLTIIILESSGKEKFGIIS